MNARPLREPRPACTPRQHGYTERTEKYYLEMQSCCKQLVELNHDVEDLYSKCALSLRG